TKLIHHRIDGVFQFENLAAHINGDLSGEIAFGHRGGNASDVTDLRSEVRSHRIDGIRQVFPRAGDSANISLPAELTFRSHLARHARDFAGEGTELVHHNIDGVL